MSHRLSHYPLAWDAAITVLMIAGLAAAWLAIATESLMFDALGFAGLIGFLLVGWGSFVEPRLIIVNKKSIQIKELHELTIAVIGDMHVGPYKRSGYMRRIVRRVNGLKPDLILLPGDFLYNHRSDASHLKPLKELRAPLGVLAVLGNHDTGNMLDRKEETFIPYNLPDRSSDVILMLDECGIPVLRNEHRIIEHDGQRFILAGTDHTLMHSCDIEQALHNAPNDVPVILLTHVPDVILDDASTKADLIICGHTHGGQIRLPLIGNLYPIPDELGSAYDQGIFRLKHDNLLAITHGIGETMARARLFCPPEILLLTVTST